jgi:hypothetical protein
MRTRRSQIDENRNDMSGPVQGFTPPPLGSDNNLDITILTQRF